MNYIFQSTMLKQNVVAQLDYEAPDDSYDEGWDNFELWQEFIKRVDDMRGEHGDAAYFAFKLEDAPDDLTWLYNRVINKLGAYQTLLLIDKANDDDWDDNQMVMAAYYAGIHDTAHDVEDAVNAGNWHIDYNTEKRGAYRDLGRMIVAEDYSLDDALEAFFDFEAFGKENASGCIQFADDDWYAFQEWN